ncbi:MAG: hypothetical protein ACE5FF_10770 [Saprospiraceae bacterium]
MKKLLAVWIFSWMFFYVHAQLGITVGTTINSATRWQVVFENFVTHQHADFLKNSTVATVDYTFYSRSGAWRFQPAAHVMRSTLTYYPHHFELTGAGILGNVTFRAFAQRDTPPLPGTLLFQFSPGLDVLSKKMDLPLEKDGQFSGEYLRYSNTGLAPSVGLNVLLDFELTGFLTVAPVAGTRYFPGVKWQDFTEILSENTLSGTFDRTGWWQYFLGLRMGLRLKNPGRSTPRVP